MAIRSMILASLVLLGTGVAAQAAAAPKRSQASADAAKNKADAEKNKKAGEAFLAENKRKEGVVTLASGLQYKVLKTGDGKRPTIDDTVVVHYRGTFVDGKEFGSSYKTGRPGTFPLRASITGWREALQLMPAGSKWQLFVPPHLAYGERGGPAIGPSSTLVFETELISVAEAEKGGKGASMPAAVTGIEVSFKLDPRLTRSLYLGDRWVSPAKFSAPPQGKTATIQANARGIDASGKRLGIAPEWKPSDPAMVEVTKGTGGDVSITVKRAGASTLKVAFQGVTKELALKASLKGEALAVEISQ